MAEKVVARVTGAATHALVVGVSKYPFVQGRRASASGKRSGLSNLSSAASSASDVASWLLTEYHNPTAPLATINVLLSPSPGERVAPAVTKALRPRKPQAATLASTNDAISTFRARLKERRDNVGFVYIAGHGVQLTKQGSIVLLEDFGHPESVSELERTVDLIGQHRGCDGDDFAGLQYWFVDSCRQPPRIAAAFERLSGPVLPDEPHGRVESSPIFFASSTREAAFEQVGRSTLFSQALLAALRGAAACPPDAMSPNWHVSVQALSTYLRPAVQHLASEDGENQYVDLTGRPNPAVVQHFSAPPPARLIVDLDPVAAAATSTASLLLNGEAPVVQDSTTWPFDHTVEPGLYTMKVDAQPPYNSIAGKPIKVDPPQCSTTVRVQP